MNTWVEITKEAFDILKGNEEALNYKKTELTEAAFYLSQSDVRLQSLTNFASCVTQYYIQDINA